LWIGERLVPAYSLESRISRLLSILDPSEERFERLIQPAKNILKYLGKDAGEVAVFLLYNQHSSLILVGSADTFGFIGVLSVSQCQIIEMSASLKI
jgi:hypothetical protein